MSLEDLKGLVPDGLAPRTRKIMLEDYDLGVDIGFHDHEIGAPQRLRVSVEVWLDAAAFPTCDAVDAAWNYDFLRTSIGEVAAARRYNLQESFCRAVYDLVAARQGVTALRVSTRKPDIYADCKAAGVELSSF